MRKHLPGLLIVLLFFVGVGILTYPAVSNLWCRYRWETEKQHYDTGQWGLSREACDALWTAAEGYNQTLAQKTDQFALSDEEKTEVSEYLNPLGIGKMGYVTIPKIGVEIPIYQGTEEDVLQAGAGWWIGTSLPTGGENTHCVLAAHNGLVKAKLFTDLNRLEEGDRFYLTVLDRVMTYEVDRIQVTEPEEREALRIVPGEDLVTLYTCTPYGVNTHRLLVRGHRLEGGAGGSGEPAGTFRCQWSLPVVFLLLPVWVLRSLLCSERRRKGSVREPDFEKRRRVR